MQLRTALIQTLMHLHPADSTAQCRVQMPRHVRRHFNGRLPDAFFRLDWTGPSVILSELDHDREL